MFLEQQRISDRELLTFYHQALYEIGFVYAAQGENTIFEIPNHPFAFIDLLLQKKFESPYRQSFLQSLLFIFVEYIALLKKGNPHLLMTEDPECLSALFITLDAYNKIVNFEAINMDLLEETKLLNQFVWMECEGKIGPLPKVYLHKRNDYR